jgi:hypothetical protein
MGIDGIGDRDDETTHHVNDLINMWRYIAPQHTSDKL